MSRRTLYYREGSAAVVAWLLVCCGCDVSPTSPAATPPSPVATPVSAKAVESAPAAVSRPKLKPGAKTVVLDRAGDKPYDKTFDDLRFEIEVGEKFARPMLTKSIESLDGQKVRIRGFILPTPQSHGIQTFVLVRDNKECCFGPGAALYDCILINMKPGNTADYTIRPIAVEGTFKINELVLGGTTMAIYQMDAESAR